MSLYPYNRGMGQRISCDVDDLAFDRGFIAHVVIDAPTSGDTAGVLALTALTTAALTIAAGSTTNPITNPDVPRVLQIDSDSTASAGNVVINGLDFNGDVIADTIALSGTNTVAGVKAFKSVSSIVLPVKIGSETVSVGISEKLGLPYMLTHNTVLKTFFNMVEESTAPAVVVDDNELCKNTIDLASALDGSKVDIFLIV